MKKFLLATAAAIAIAAPAQAADMPVKARPAPAFSWTGVYVGGHLGGATTRTEWTWEITPLLPETVGATNRASSFAGGAHVGFQYQWMNGIVAGLEASYTAMRTEDTVRTTGFGGLARDLTARVDAVTLVLGKLGIAHDRWMIYAKGGLAWADVKLNADRPAQPGFAFLPQTSGRSWLDGFAVGGGIDYAVMPNVLLGVDATYLRVRGERTDVQLPGTLLSHHRDIETSAFMATARVSWLFNGPVVARY